MIETSRTLETKVTHLQERMQAANISIDDMQAFQRVADVLDNGHGSIDVDDLIALSFVTPMDPEDLQCSA